ncbi:unnamed protein product [Acanthoscelides obtectus]|uniref:Uncharacterized protein n=1 Tax=Acanthoscelides obtectus TaxID=200917 RepID=A0A9P0M6I2_ACAOB|nr:unnamed protein product [Acanthoscelides obtectus]CAK1635357.1 Pickpocket protein 28 [Acanthoscelides obtectus]
MASVKSSNGDESLGNVCTISISSITCPAVPSQGTIERTITEKQVKNGRAKISYYYSGTKGYFREYCESTTIHGFKYLSEKRSICERILWVLLISLSISACGFLISRIYNRFITSPVIVSFATKESPLYSIPFPAVTICPMTKVKKSVYNFTRVIYRVARMRWTSREEGRYGQYLSLLCRHGQMYFRKSRKLFNDFYEIIDRMKLNLSEYTEECQVGVNDPEPCEKLFQPIIVDEGICYTYNMLDRTAIFRDEVYRFKDYHKNEKKVNWDIDNGYTFNDSTPDGSFLNYPNNAYLSGYENGLHITFRQSASELDYLCSPNSQGFKVSLHAPHELPQLKKQFFQVSFGDAIMAAVQPKMTKTSQQVRKYNPVKRECYFSNEKYLRYFKQYTSSNCRQECYANYTSTVCGCAQFYMPRTSSTGICGSAKFMIAREPCTDAMESVFKEEEAQHSASNQNGTSFCDCRRSCVDINYEVQLSQYAWNYGERDPAHYSNQKNESYVPFVHPRR